MITGLSTILLTHRHTPNYPKLGTTPFPKNQLSLPAALKNVGDQYTNFSFERRTELCAVEHQAGRYSMT